MFSAGCFVGIIGALLAVLDTADAAADRRLPVVVGAERLGIGQHGLEELDGDDLDAVVNNGVDAGHADVLNDAQVREVLLPESHPEAGAPDRGIVFDERLELLVVDDVGLALADPGIIQRPVYLVGLGDDPAPVFVVAAFLRHLADVDLGVEVGGESHAVVAGVAVDDIEIMNLVEMVLGGVGREDSRDARVEAAAEDRGEAGGLEPILVGPLPRILEMGLVLGLVVGGIEVVAAALETGVHDGEILIREGDVDDDIGLESAEQLAQLGDAVGIDLRGFDAAAADSRSHGVALGLGAAGEHDLREDGVGGDLLGDDRADAPGTDNQGFTHKRCDLDEPKNTFDAYKNIVLFW